MCEQQLVDGKQVASAYSEILFQIRLGFLGYLKNALFNQKLALNS